MRWLAGATFLVVLLLTGCSDEAGLDLRDWTFVGPHGERSPVVLPTHVDDRLPHERTRYVLQRVVALDARHRGHDLVLAIPRLEAHATLRVDGVEASAIDDADRSGYRARGPHAWRIPSGETASENIEIELEVEHTWTQSGWLDTVPHLTTAPDGGAQFLAVRVIDDAGDFAALGMTIFVGYIYLVIFLADRRRTTYLWFALTGISGFTYALFQTAIASRFLGPFEVTLVAVGVSSAVITQLHFTRGYFGEPPVSRVWDVAWALVVTASVVSTGYFTGTRVAGIATVALAVPGILTQTALLARLARRKLQPVNLYFVLVGWALLPILGAADFAAWCGLGEWLGGVRTADLDITLIALLQSAVVSRDHTLSLRRADELAEERRERIVQLEEQKREVEVLNDELRRQIAARSRALGTAITRLTGTPGARELLEGEVIEGRYEVLRKLGSGAAGSVYLVERRGDRALLAMKVVRGTHEPHALARLAREAQLAATVKHENVISVVDVDVAESGFLYIVMEYVAGENLREHRGQYGQLPWAIDVLRQIAAALAAIHERGIVHRDLKPANVLLVPCEGRTPRVKIADFGIAGVTANAAVDTFASVRPPPLPGSAREAIARPSDLRLTETGVLLGTPLYMAPETIDGAKNPAPSVDVFSFGVIAYEVLTGKAPFQTSPALAQLEGEVVAPPESMRVTAPGVPADVSSIVDRCLAFDASQRPEALEVSAALRDAVVPES